MQDYINLFIDAEYPYFIDKYLNTKTLDRIKHVTQFCGSDYTKLYSPLFLYTRYHHSLVVAHMTWHFTHDKKQTIAALFHDVGTPCFAHCIDYVLGDYMNQESSEKNILDIIKEDEQLLLCLQQDDISLDDLNSDKYPILENKSPQLCTDRLDGVLHTCYIWLHTNSLWEIKEIYDDMEVLINEQGKEEIGFKDIDKALKFVSMVKTYAMELQGNTDKYVMKYISEVVKIAIQEKIISLDDLYVKKEEDIVDVLKSSFPSWASFSEAEEIVRTNMQPNNFYISFNTKKRNTIPLVRTINGNKRIIDVSKISMEIYESLKEYKDSKYAYLDDIKVIEIKGKQKRYQ